MGSMPFPRRALSFLSADLKVNALSLYKQFGLFFKATIRRKARRKAGAEQLHMISQWIAWKCKQVKSEAQTFTLAVFYSITRTETNLDGWTWSGGIPSTMAGLLVDILWLRNPPASMTDRICLISLRPWAQRLIYLEIPVLVRLLNSSNIELG